MRHRSDRSCRLGYEALEARRMLAVSLGDLQAAGISQRVVDYIEDSSYTSEILGDATLANTLRGLNGTRTAPPGATVLASVGDLSQITSGTVANPNVYLIQGDLSVTNTIQVPSNVHIYVDGSIFKQGAFTAPGGVHSVENSGANADAIFRLNGADNVKLIGVNNALLHSTPNLSVNSPHATAIYIHSNSDNVEVDGFEIAWVWNAVAAHPFNITNITVTNNYIHDTLDRAVWSLGTTNFRAAHNFVENPGIDSFDWDAFTDDAIGYENVSIGAGRWAGFVEEGTEDSYFIRGLGMIADFGNPNRGFMLGWADNGSSQFFVNNNPNPNDWTEHNYFIDNVIFTEGDVPQSGGDYFAKNNHGKGPTYFWANRGFGAGQSATFFDNAEWLTFLPTAGGRNSSVNAVQLLIDLNAEFNPPIPLLPGDFNEDGAVDAADQVVWRDTEGQTGAGLAADADASGTVDAGDRAVWLANYGRRFDGSFLEQGGAVSIEAENFHYSSAGVGALAGHTWSTIADGAASDGAAVTTTPNSGASAGLTTDGPRLDYEVYFDQPGVYRVFVRMNAATTLDNSVHLGLNGAPVTNLSPTGQGLAVSTGGWAWVDDVQAGATDVTVTVPHAGLHTLNLWMREDGTEVDKIVLDVAGNVPVGVGPAESPRFGQGTSTASFSGEAAAGQQSEAAAAVFLAPEATSLAVGSTVEQPRPIEPRSVDRALLLVGTDPAPRAVRDAVEAPAKLGSASASERGADELIAVDVAFADGVGNAV